MPPRMKTKDFIEKAKIIHGNKYNYSLTRYVNSCTKVKIICNRHNIVFEQTPNNHLSGHGCSECSDNRKLTNNNLIDKFVLIHGDKYDYSKVNVVGSKIKVKIKCLKHNGYFYQTPNNHLKGAGCPFCAKNKKLNTVMFIKKAKNIHGVLYNYSCVNYIGSQKKVKILCNKCKSFFYQRPNDHLSGSGCPNCNIISRGENKVKCVLKKYNVEYEREKKFKQCVNPSTRFKLPFDFYLPQFNVLIEYDGELHYEPSRFKNGQNKFIKQKELDKIKDEFANINNMLLLRIPYFEIDNIEQIIIQSVLEKN